MLVDFHSTLAAGRRVVSESDCQDKTSNPFMPFSKKTKDVQWSKQSTCSIIYTFIFLLTPEWQKRASLKSTYTVCVCLCVSEIKLK